MAKMLKTSFKIIVISTLTIQISAQDAPGFVEVYPGPGNMSPSDDYALTVSQDGEQQQAFVYKNRDDDPADAHIRREVSRGIAMNPDLNAWYTGTEGPSPQVPEQWPEAVRSVSWTTFSFSRKIGIRVSCLKGEVEQVKVLPSSRGIVPSVQGNELRFELERPEKLALIINGDFLNPLYVFADQSEMHKPDPEREGTLVFRPGDDYESMKEGLEKVQVLWFAPGIHDLGAGFPVHANQTIYLAGGAYVYGTFHGMMANNVSFRGRGVLSGEKIPREYILELKKDRTKNNFERMKTHNISMLSEGNRDSWNVYAQYGGSGCDNLLIEGITIVDASHFFARVTGYPITIHNLKMVGGWHHNSDGISAIGQPNTTVFDCFFHCNDDGIYVRPDNLHVHHCVFWQGTNGAVFQWSWGGDPYDQGGGYIHDCDIIHVGHVHEANNRAVFGSRKSGPGDIRDIYFRNINIEGPVWRVFRLNTYAGRGEPASLGSIYDILFENIRITGPVINKSEIISSVDLEEGVESASWVRDITFRNVRINDRLMDEKDFIMGNVNVTNIHFEK